MRNNCNRDRNFNRGCRNFNNNNRCNITLITLDLAVMDLTTALVVIIG